MRARNLLVLTLGLVTTCNNGGGANSGPDGSANVCMAANNITPRSDPIEFVGLTVQQPVTATQFMAIVDPIFGMGAQNGTHDTDYALQPGVLLTTTTDTRTATQAVIQLDMLTSDTTNATPRRTILRVPASYQYGQLFINTVQAALTQANSVWTSSPGDARPWWLEYHVTSIEGGDLHIRVDWNNGQATLTFQTQNPSTSLTPGHVNQAAFAGEPYEVLGGTVNFNLSRDEFSFFSTRAYGITAGAAQNFQDFELEPHNWLRLTVTPDLTNRLVNVAFNVMMLNGTEVPFAHAPASVLAGDQFQQNVFRLMDNMTAQETAHAGSSTPFTSSFYYDDPTGGGVVQVILSGNAGVFTAAYSVQSPTNTLRDVAFVNYTAQIATPTSLAPPAMTCEQMGSTTALQGEFVVTFAASSTVRTSPSLTVPLRGTVYGSVYRASDVTIVGPNAGAQPVASFTFPNVDLTSPTQTMTYTIPTALPVGSYQILGFMDTLGTADSSNPSPATNEPVTLPIGAYTIACAMQSVSVEFALLLPAGQ